MLYEALFVPPGAAPFPADIVDAPGIVDYHADFGTRSGDVGVVATIDDAPVGAAWVRRLHGYGFVDDTTPELTVAVVAAHRGRGIGDALLASLWSRVERCSLSCDRRNPAIRLYERHGFAIVDTDGEHSVTMLRDDASTS
ncbi:MAG: GNAT family N-acetyltransferase [Acidimicrobiaceae bacterium]|nr:GNAT family N-acetyltransferase [Acidimicrobiaceae bacterium]